MPYSEFMELTILDIKPLALCLTIRERPANKGALWLKKTRVGRVDSLFLAKYWLNKARKDPSLKKRIESLYLENFSKFGVPNSQIDCRNAPRREYPTDLVALHPQQRGTRRLEARVRELLPVEKQRSLNLKASPPPTFDMAKRFAKSMIKWTASRFKLVDVETFNRRVYTCMKCEFWEKEAFNGTGRCLKCGCSTKAKLRLATEQCPIGKWGTE